MDINKLTREIGESEAIVEFKTTPARALILISHLQLALRHPDNTGESAKIAKQIAENMTDAICLFIPDARELIETGWDTSRDITQEEYDLQFSLQLPEHQLPIINHNYD